MGGYISPPSGGGGGYADWVSAGTGGDFADISAAIAAGKDHIVLISNVTESSNIVVPSTGLLLDVNGYILTMGDFEFTTASAYPITVYAGGGEITFAHLDTVDLFSVAFNTKITLRDLKIKNLGTNNTAISTATNAILDFDNVEITVGNVSSAGISISKNDFHSLRNVTFIGGGTSSTAGLVVSGSAKISVENMRFDAIWQLGATLISSFSPNFNADGLIINIQSTASIAIEGVLKNVRSPMASTLSVNLNASNVQISGMNGTDINLNLFGFDDLILSDIDFGVGGIVDGSGGLGNFFTNMIINDPATILGDKYKFTNVTFLGGATNSAAADDNDYVGCQFGSNTGGGANTMTISAAANRTSLTGCRGDAIYSDSGTATSIVGWQTF